MRKFSYTDLNRKSGEILDMAAVEPVALTKQKTVRLVIVSADEYRRLTAAAVAEAHSIDDMPRDLIDGLIEGFDNHLEHKGSAALAPGHIALASLDGAAELDELIADAIETTEIPEQYRWNSDDDEVTDEQRGAGR